MSDQQSVELHKKGHALVLAGDREGMAALVAESSDWHITGHRSDAFGVDRRKRAALGGDFHGRAGFFDFIDKLEVLSGETFSFDDIAVMGEGEYSTALMKVTATRGSASLDAVVVEIGKWGTARSWKSDSCLWTRRLETRSGPERIRRDRPCSFGIENGGNRGMGYGFEGCLLFPSPCRKGPT